MHGPTHVKLHHQFVALIDRICMQKINFIPLTVFKILKFKNPTIWLAKGIFAFNSKHRFFPDMRFKQNRKGHYGAWFKPKKNLYINDFFFCCCKVQKTLFWVFWGHYSQNEIFSQKSDPVNFLPLRQPNFLWSFRKILYAVLGKTCLPADMLTYWHNDNREIIGPLFP